MIQKPPKNEAKTVPRGLQNSEPPRSWWVLAAKRPQEASKTAQEAPKRPPRRSKMAQDAPKTAQDGSRRAKTAPRRPQTAPRRLQDASKTPKDAPRRLKNAQKCPRMLNNAMKSRKIQIIHFKLYQRIPDHWGGFQGSPPL